VFPYDPLSITEECGELDAWRSRLDRPGGFSRRWWGRMRRDLEAEAVAASVGIEQVPVTVDEVRRILVGERLAEVRPEDQALVRGYRDAMEFVLRRADDGAFRWSRELVTGLHDRVLAGNYAAEAGRFATGARWVANNFTGQVVFNPAPADSIPDLVDRACEYVQGSGDHPAVLSAWIHVVTAAIHPFRDGNGRVARIVASLAMYRGGFRRREFTSLEEWWGRHVTDYYAAFACLGDTFDETLDVTPFIEAHVQAQLSQVRALDLRERTQRVIWSALEQVIEDAHLQPRVVNAVWDAFFGRPVTPAYYIPLADVSRATATNDLGGAVSAGLLVPRRGGRARHYVAAPDVYSRVGDVLGIEVPQGGGREHIIAALSRELAQPVD
jgi:Fic family protein